MKKQAEYIKYPRTRHLPTSPGGTEDDLRLTEDDASAMFEGRHVVMLEKMDGDNTTMYRDHIHARSLDSRHHPSRNWVKQLHGQIAHEIPEGWRICGENLQAQHSIGYKDLPSYFMVFSIWDETNTCLSWRETEEWAELLGLNTVPVIYEGLFDTEAMEQAWKAYASPYGDIEGYVVRLADGFHFSDFPISIAKWVRPNHVQTDVDWVHKEMIENGLRVSHKWSMAERTGDPELDSLLEEFMEGEYEDVAETEDGRSLYPAKMWYQVYGKWSKQSYYIEDFHAAIMTPEFEFAYADNDIDGHGDVLYENFPDVDYPLIYRGVYNPRTAQLAHISAPTYKEDNDLEGMRQAWANALKNKGLPMKEFGVYEYVELPEGQMSPYGDDYEYRFVKMWPTISKKSNWTKTSYYIEGFHAIEPYTFLPLSGKNDFSDNENKVSKWTNSKMAYPSHSSQKWQSRLSQIIESYKIKKSHWLPGFRACILDEGGVFHLGDADDTHSSIADDVGYGFDDAEWDSVGNEYRGVGMPHKYIWRGLYNPDNKQLLHMTNPEEFKRIKGRTASEILMGKEELIGNDHKNIWMNAAQEAGLNPKSFGYLFGDKDSVFYMANREPERYLRIESSSKEIRKLIKELLANGFNVNRGTSGHYKITHPRMPGTVFMSSTPSDRNAFKNIKKDLQRTFNFIPRVSSWTKAAYRLRESKLSILSKWNRIK